MKDKRIRFGVNYIPSKRWWFQWISWDSGEIEEDLAAIAELGFDHIRIQCLWPYFQPQAGWVNAAMVDRLEELLDIAGRYQLSVEVTVLDGWLSGYAFYPSWMLDKGRPLNIFREELVIKAEELFYRTLAERIARHPAFMGFDIGNEINVLMDHGQELSVEEGDAWQDRIMGLCEQIAPGAFHVNGVDHRPWLLGEGFSRKTLANVGSASVIHCYGKWTGASDRYGPCGIGVVRLAEFMSELTAAYALTPDRPVWLQEFGASDTSMPGSLLEGYAELSVRSALSSRHCRLVTWWGSHEIDPVEFPDFSPGEYQLGLLDTKNRVKPVGRVFERLIKEFTLQPAKAETRQVAIEIPESLFDFGVRQDEASRMDRAWLLGKAFMDLRADGVAPAFLRERDAADPAIVAARGIGEIRKLAWAR
jgi:hypothetical protein